MTTRPRMTGILTADLITARERARRFPMIRPIAQTSFVIVLAGFLAPASATPAVAQVAGGFGVGTSTPDAALHVFRDDKTAQLHIEDASTAVGNQVLLLMETAAGSPIVRYGGPFRKWDFTGGNFFTINDPSDAAIEMKLNAAGNLTISGDFFAQGGTKLDVPDYVFADDYPLMPLSELEAFVQQHSHLPNVPSAETIDADGMVNMTKMQMLLLQKVEELTLYTLQQQREIEALKAKLQR